MVNKDCRNAYRPMCNIQDAISRSKMSNLYRYWQNHPEHGPKRKFIAAAVSCPCLRRRLHDDVQVKRTAVHLDHMRLKDHTEDVYCPELKPNSITLASSELAPSMFEAGSCQIELH